MNPYTDLHRDDESMSSEVSEDEHRGKRFQTAPTTPARQMSIVGQITKPRVSPRNLAKKDYKAIEDPFVENGAHDADGNNIFERSGSDTEENASDDAYDKPMEVVKVEDGVGP